MNVQTDPSRPRVVIVMRSFNDAGVIGTTLEAVHGQTYRNFELWNFDSSSTDGTLDVIRQFNVPGRIRLNDSRSYNPGRVLNEAVAATTGEILVFLNSDATPADSHWLERLIEPLDDPAVGAVFGRQVSRPDCRPLFVQDTERAFGDGALSSRWPHFFSMANSAARRAVLEAHPFETRIQYSEDVDWSYRLRRSGLQVRYVAAAPEPQAALWRGHGGCLDFPCRRDPAGLPALLSRAVRYGCAPRCRLGAATSLAGRAAAHRSPAWRPEMGALARFQGRSAEVSACMSPKGIPGWARTRWSAASTGTSGAFAAPSRPSSSRRYFAR
jgi:rhamnosyltransferase